MDSKGRPPLDHAQFKARLSMSNSKHSTISTLTDQALIAFEIEHERNRLREELNRLQSAQDDAQRCLEILNFMSSHMDSDPLVNPSINPSKPHYNNHRANHSKHSNHKYLGSNHLHHDEMLREDNDLPPTLEYLPSNTIIRLANKQVRKISEIRVGDKILSLCINSYPNSTANANGKSHNAYLPKPSTKRLSQTVLSRSKSSGASPSTNLTANANGYSPKRQRARTKPNINIPFMLPPPVQHPLNNNSAAQQHPPKLDSLPRKSMPYLPLNPNHHHYHNGNNNRNNKNSPNLIHQSVTAAVNESLILSPGIKSNDKIRSKSFVAPHILYHKEDDEDREPHKHLDSNRLSTQSFTQIPGPRPPLKQNKLNRNRLSYSPNMMRKARSQNNSPRFSKQPHNHHKHNKYVKKTRFSTNDSNNVRSNSLRRNKNGNYLEPVGVTKVVEHKIYQMIEINTENDFKIRCTPTHLFWICGKGWGCFDSQKRIRMEQNAAALLHKQNNNSNTRKKVKIPYIIHELQKGEQLLSVGGNKYRISDVNFIKKPQGIHVYGIVVSKNECFFANDLLVKNSIS